MTRHGAPYGTRKPRHASRAGWSAGNETTPMLRQILWDLATLGALALFAATLLIWLTVLTDPALKFALF